MSRSIRPSSTVVFVFTALAAAALVGCNKQYVNPNVALGGIPKALEIGGTNINIVVVSPEAATPPNKPTKAFTFPKDQLIGGTYAVIWVGDGKHLAIHFDNTGSFQPNCAADMAICVALPPYPVKDISYSGTLVDNSNNSLPLEPHLEVVK